jgi:hypothetical protein
MAYLNNVVLDGGLQYLTSNVSTVHICSAEPTDNATLASLSLGTKTAVVIGAPTDRVPTGRRVIIPAIVAGDVTATATATHWALATGGGVLLASGSLTASQVVTSGNTFALAAFDIGFPGLV